MLTCVSLAVALAVANAAAYDPTVGERVASTAVSLGKCARTGEIAEGEIVVQLDSKEQKNVMLVVRKVLVWNGTEYRPFFTVDAVRFFAV